MTKKQCLDIHIYVPDKIDETILVYFDLGFKILVYVNDQLLIFYQSTVDYDWVFHDDMKCVSEDVLDNLQYTDLSGYFTMCSRTELRRLIEYNYELCKI